MIEFKVIISSVAEKDLKKLSKTDENRAREAINGLAKNPVAGKRLPPTPFWSIRIGKYRIIYDIRGQILEVLVLMVDKRDIVYKRLRKLKY